MYLYVYNMKFMCQARYCTSSSSTDINDQLKYKFLAKKFHKIYSRITENSNRPLGMLSIKEKKNCVYGENRANLKYNVWAKCNFF
jgi:hypothetical protein